MPQENWNLHHRNVNRNVNGSAKDRLPGCVNSPPAARGSQESRGDPYFGRAQYLVRVGAAAVRGRVDLIFHIFEIGRGHCEEWVVALGKTVAAVLPLYIDLAAAFGEGDLRTGAVRRWSKRHCNLDTRICLVCVRLVHKGAFK